VLIIRRAKKRDAGIYRCNLAGSTTRHKYMVLNVTGEYAVPDLRRDLDEATLALENCSGEGTIFWLVESLADIEVSHAERKQIEAPNYRRPWL